MLIVFSATFMRFVTQRSYNCVTTLMTAVKETTDAVDDM